MSDTRAGVNPTPPGVTRSAGSTREPSGCGAPGASGDGTGSQPGPGGRSFVTVIAGGREGLLALRALDLDLFKPTAREAVPTAPGDPGRAGEFTVEGLLTLEEIGRLVSAGYRVLVHEDAAQKARGQISPRRSATAGAAGGAADTARAARAAPAVAPQATEAVGFEEWLQGMQEPQRRPARRKRG
ncbi:MAG TPA: hypothetical protein VHQ00_02200 [Chloroflexota bacterium]|nr:hypothetical protein [Chloroflexota bacterium]